MTDPERFDEAVMPLRSFCDAQGLAWRWKIERKGRGWKATVQIVNPEGASHRDRMMAWYSASGEGEMQCLVSAIEYAIEAVKDKLQISPMRGTSYGAAWS
jgi:hypothetical protein